MKSIHNTIQHQQSTDVTDDTSDTLLCAHTLAQPVCTAADSPTANSGRGMMNACRSIRGGWRSIAVLIAFAAMLAVCIAPTLAAWATAELDFTPPTPADDATIYDDHTTINVSIATDNLTYFAFNWNGTNYTYTTCGTEWNVSADSHTRITTVGTPPVDFDNTFPWSHIRRCTLQDDGTVNYYLNATNSSLKATGGLADLGGDDGQVMVEIPKFYINHTYIGPPTYVHDWKISRFNTSGFTVHKAFVKNGEEVDYRYIGAYEGSMRDASTGEMVSSDNITTNMYESGDKLCSVSGAYPKTNEMRSEFRDMAADREPGWRQQDYDLISAVQLLYLIEYADCDSQTKIGMGRTERTGSWVADSNIGQCGKSNSDGDGTNSVDGNTDDAYMTYRGIENFYGNVWNWVDGININNHVPYVSNNDAFWNDSTDTGYTNLIGPLKDNDGWQAALLDTDRGFLPVSTDPTPDYVHDYYWQSTITVRCIVALGGCASGTGGGTQAGAFCASMSGGDSACATSIGGRLAY